MNLLTAVRVLTGILLLFPPLWAQTQLRHLTIEESLHLALANNEALLIAEETYSKSQQQVREAAADAFPQFTASASYTRNWLLPTFIFGNQQITVGARHNMSGSLGIRQALYSGGKVFTGIRIARMYREYSAEGVRTAKQGVCAEVEIAYYDWLLDRAYLLVPAQAYVGNFLTTFKEFPPRQKAASFSLDQVMEKLNPTSH